MIAGPDQLTEWVIDGERVRIIDGILSRLPRPGPNQSGRIAKVYGGPFCSRLIGDQRSPDNNPVTERWYGSHLMPIVAMQEDAAARNRALQSYLAGQRKAADPPRKAGRPRR